MKEQKSHMSLVARFVYIFATIVTVFAQMGAAVPAMITDADNNSVTTAQTATANDPADRSGGVIYSNGDIKVQASEWDPNVDHSDHHITLTISGSNTLSSDDIMKDKDGNPIKDTDGTELKGSFNLDWHKAGITPLQTGFGNKYLIQDLEDKGFVFKWNKLGDHSVVIGLKPLANGGTRTMSGSPGWTFTLAFSVTGEYKGGTFTITDKTGDPIAQTQNGNGGGFTPPDDSANQPTDDPKPTGDTHTLKQGDLGLTQMDKSPYDIGSNINLMFTAELGNYPTTYRDVQFKINETDENGNATNSKATFDPDATKALLEPQGYTVSGPTKNEDHTEYTYSNGIEEYHVWVFSNNDIRVEWPKGTTGSKGGFIVMKAKEASTKVTLTPTFVGSTAANDTPVDLQAGTSTDFVIKPAAVQPATQIDGSTFRFDPTAVNSPDVNKDGSSPYRMSAFPLFYIKDDSTYAFAYNNNAVYGTGGDKNALNNLRKAIIAGTDYGSLSGAKSTTNDEPAYFENFHEINADGTIKAGTEKKFEVGKTYTLTPYNPVAGTQSRFMRLDPNYKSGNYYMPDGIPQITVDESGNMHLKGDSDGHAVKGQWQANGKTLSVKLYHVKKVKVVDEAGNAVKGATLTLKNTSGNASYLHGTTKDDGTGDLYPSDNSNSDATHPFYYPAGDEAFDKLTLPAGYTQDIAFSGMTLDTKADTLSLSSDKKNAKIIDNDQTLQLTVHKLTPDETSANSQVQIQKISNADATALEGAEFKVVEIGNATDSWGTKTLTTDANGILQGIAVDANSKTQTRTFHITETKAPAGYAIGNRSGYDVTWTKGKGFTAIGSGSATTSDDKLVTIKTGGILIIDDPKVTDAESNGGKFTIQKIDKNDPNATVPDGAVFTVTQTTPSENPTPQTITTKNGKATFDLGAATADDKVFEVIETKAPAGYEANTNTQGYFVRIQADGTTTVADGPTLSSDIIKTQTTDSAVKVATSSDGHMITFGDVKKVSQGNGGLFSVQKLAKNDPLTVLPGATFSLDEVTDAGVKAIGQADATTGFSDVTTGSDGKLSFDLGTATQTDRYFKLIERTAPVGYTLDTRIYAIKIAVDGTVAVAPIDATSKAASIDTKDPGAAFRAMPSVAFAQASPDGAVQATGTGVTFSDSKIADQNNGTLVIKKVDMTDRTKGLANAEFGFAENINTRPLGYTLKEGPYLSDASGIVKVDLNTTTNSTRMIKVKEGQAPSGYKQNASVYRILIDPSGKYTVSQQQSNGDYSTPSDKTPDGVMQVDANNNVTFGDQPDVVKNNGFVIQKVDADDKPITTGLDNAAFSVTEIKIPGPNADLGKFPLQAGGVTKAIIPAASTSNSQRLFMITETAAPTGYTKSDKSYYVTTDASGAVVGVSDDGTTPATRASKDGVVKKADSGKVTFADTKAPVKNGTVTIKKVAAGSNTPLAGAKFTLEDLGTGFAVKAATDSKVTPVTEATGTDGQQQFTVSPTPAGQLQRMFKVTETQAPTGYNKLSAPYYILWSADKGVLTVGTSATTADVVGTIKTADGAAAVTPQSGTTPGYLSIADTPAQVIKLKKQNAQGQPLSGAKMVITETTATGSSYGATDKLPQQHLTTAADGIFQFTPTATAAGSTHYYKVTEETAPAGYARGADTWIVYKVGTGVVGVKTKEGSTVADSAGPMTWSKADQLITYIDQPLSFTLQVRRQVGNATNSVAVLENVQKAVGVKLEDVDDPSITLNYAADPETGDITVDTQAMAKQLGLTAAPSTGQVKFKMTVDPATADSFTVPSPRNVIFKWGAKGGFYIDPSDNDLMVTDVNTSSQGTNSPITDGNLRIHLRRDTLVARPAAADENGNDDKIPNATFNLTYKDAGGQTLGTQKVTTNANGVGLIQEPSAFLKSAVPLNSGIFVTITQDTAVDGYEKFDSPMGMMTYNSVSGFQLFNPNPGNVVQFDPTTGLPDSEVDEGAQYLDPQSQITTELYKFGGSQIEVPLDPIISDVILNSAPHVMNFGKAKAMSGAQTLDLLPKTAAADQQAEFDTGKLSDSDAVGRGTLTDDAISTHPNFEATAEETGDFLNAQVTQIGTFTNGWQLKMAMSTLTSEDGTDTITGGSVTMGRPLVYRDHDNNSDDDVIELNTGFLNTTVNMDGIEPVKDTTLITAYSDAEKLVDTRTQDVSQAGIYHMFWNVNDVKMNLPAMVGKLNTNYQSTMAWALTWAP